MNSMIAVIKNLFILRCKFFVRWKKSILAMSDKVRHACTTPQNMATDLEADDLSSSYLNFKQHSEINNVVQSAMIDVMRYELP